MCEYCSVKVEEEKNMAVGNWCGAGIKLKKDGSWVLFCWGDDEAETKINFCPKCGRELK